MARILVIDDEDLVRRTLRKVLEQDGHQVIEACNGREAIRLQGATPVELVITDIYMPERDGLEVIMALRQTAPDLKIIAMSGGGRLWHADSLGIAEPLGAVASLRKPFSIETLRETVSRALAA